MALNAKKSKTARAASWAVLLSGFCAAPLFAQNISLEWPVDCVAGETCFIQQYVDRDPGPGARDFTCSRLSYDGHTGTDIRVSDLEAMATGVVVTAAAPGRVQATRDGMEDAFLTPERRAEMEGRGCGNGVVLTHEGGWQTLYCHLKRGSISVQQGDTVVPGTPLGEIGLSGFTDFPHLEFQVRRGDTHVDPFAPDGLETCGTQTDDLWAQTPLYQPGGILSAGFADHVPDFDAIQAGTADAANLPLDAPALVIWGYVFGARAGDALELAIIGPGGQEVIRNRADLDRTQAQLFRATGLRLRAERWRGGLYRGELTLWRGEVEIDRMVTIISLND